MSATQKWEAAVDGFVQNGLTISEAKRWADHANPGLREAYLSEFNRVRDPLQSAGWAAEAAAAGYRPD
jgi:hypothetical protein